MCADHRRTITFPTTAVGVLSKATSITVTNNTGVSITLTQLRSP